MPSYEIALLGRSQHTGRELTLQGINIFRVRDRRIAERWGRLDQLGLFRQLGLVPDPPARPRPGEPTAR